MGSGTSGTLPGVFLAGLFSYVGYSAYNSPHKKETPEEAQDFHSNKAMRWNRETNLAGTKWASYSKNHMQIVLDDTPKHMKHLMCEMPKWTSEGSLGQELVENLCL